MGAARPLHCDALVLSMLGFGHQFLPPNRQSKALRSSSGSLAKFAAICRASSRVEPIWSPSGATLRYVWNRGMREARGLRLKHGDGPLRNMELTGLMLAWS
jgi:hypothetical protein